jgi:B12-binding domain/radical SAM domain protein of rhizo-twelve system
MRVALVNPPWSFRGSIYFGCREPHLPLELGYAAALLGRAGHAATIVDAQAHGLGPQQIRDEVTAFRADAAVITTAPSYLFWRCAPPELRVPQEVMRAIRGTVGLTIAVGPHASTTPRAVLRKLGVDVAVLGECEEVLPLVCDAPRAKWGSIPSIAFRDAMGPRVTCGPRVSDLASLPALTWDDATVQAHDHHHHRFDQKPMGPGAEIEASRGCPYRCTFCAKEEFRDRYRKRPLSAVLEELDRLIAQGVKYVYFIDEIFLPEVALLESLARRDVVFGVQLRIDNWSKEMLDLLGRAGCVSIEAGVESVTPEGRSLLDKRCRMSTADLAERLVHAKSRVPFVQANLLESESDPPEQIQAFRDELRRHGVWANDPVPLFPYPGSPEYRLRFGQLDDEAWERAVGDYLARFGRMSEIQDDQPLPLSELESAPLGA